MSPTTLADDRLVSLAAAGDGVAFEALYERHYRSVYRYVLSILRDPEDARDALQSTMERALRSIDSQRVKGGLRAWLFGIAHNEAMNAIATRPPRPPAEAVLVAADAASDAADRDRLRQLIEDLGALPERQRSALVLRELSGLASEEIGTALSISPAAAKQNVYEARVALTKLAEGRDMSCERVQQKLSDGDGRRLRGRGLRAHLRDCALCQAFGAGIGTRTADLPVLFPPLAAAAAAKTLAEVTAGGGGAAAAGATGGATSNDHAPVGGKSSLRDRRAAAAGVGLVALLALGGALGATRGDSEPAVSNAVKLEAPKPVGPREQAPGPREAAPGPREQASPEPVPGAEGEPETPSSLTGYSQFDPSVIQVLAAGDGSRGDDSDDTGGNGSDDTGGAGDAANSASGGSLAFTGLETLVLVAAGLGLLGLGLAMRLLGRRPSL